MGVWQQSATNPLVILAGTHGAATSNHTAVTPLTATAAAKDDLDINLGVTHFIITAIGNAWLTGDGEANPTSGSNSGIFLASGVPHIFGCSPTNPPRLDVWGDTGSVTIHVIEVRA